MTNPHLQNLTAWLQRWDDWLDAALLSGAMTLSPQSRQQLQAWSLESQQLGFGELHQLSQQLLADDTHDNHHRATLLLQLNALNSLYQQHIMLDELRERYAIQLTDGITNNPQP